MALIILQQVILETYYLQHYKRQLYLAPSAMQFLSFESCSLISGMEDTFFINFFQLDSERYFK